MSELDEIMLAHIRPTQTNPERGGGGRTLHQPIEVVNTRQFTPEALAEQLNIRES